MFQFFTQRRSSQTLAYLVHRFVPSVCCLLVASFIWLGQPAAAQGQSGAQGEAAQQVTGPVNERQALQIARARFPGNVISINEVRQNGRVRFRIRMDNEGNIFTVYIDKATGVVIEG